MTKILINNVVFDSGKAMNNEVRLSEIFFCEDDVICEKEKWPGWPGDNVFRLVVPFNKVGCIIGYKGEFVKKMCNATGARIRVLDAPPNTNDRVVLVSAREETHLHFSPAMDAVLKIFLCVSGLSTTEMKNLDSHSYSSYCPTKLLISATQAMYLIGNQGSKIKSIQKSSGAIVRVLSEDEGPSYVTQEDRIVEIIGEALKVLKALEAVIALLRMFLVDHSVIPIFEKMFCASVSQDALNDAASMQDYPFTFLNDSTSYDREVFDPFLSTSGMPPLHSSTNTMHSYSRPLPTITKVIQTMEVPISYVEDIIGLGGRNFSYIRSSSGASLTIKETDGVREDIIVEIKGTSSQVQIAQQLVQEFISGHIEPNPPLHGHFENWQSTYSELGDGTYPSSSYENVNENKPWDWVPWCKRWN